MVGPTFKEAAASTRASAPQESRDEDRHNAGRTAKALVSGLSLSENVAKLPVPRTSCFGRERSRCLRGDFGWARLDGESPASRRHNAPIVRQDRSQPHRIASANACWCKMAGGLGALETTFSRTSIHRNFMLKLCLRRCNEASPAAAICIGPWWCAYRRLNHRRLSLLQAIHPRHRATHLINQQLEVPNPRNPSARYAAMPQFSSPVTESRASTFIARPARHAPPCAHTRARAFFGCTLRLPHVGHRELTASSRTAPAVLINVGSLAPARATVARTTRRGFSCLLAEPSIAYVLRQPTSLDVFHAIADLTLSFRAASPRRASRA